MLIIGGTSLTVYPAAGLVRSFRGKNLVVINRDATQADAGANLVIADSIGAVFSAVL
jgi:NAD-dependent deacetylase